jgi:hypothetical protein
LTEPRPTVSCVEGRELFAQTVPRIALGYTRAQIQTPARDPALPACLPCRSPIGEARRLEVSDPRIGALSFDKRWREDNHPSYAPCIHAGREHPSGGFILPLGSRKKECSPPDGVRAINVFGDRPCCSSRSSSLVRPSIPWPSILSASITAILDLPVETHQIAGPLCPPPGDRCSVAR